MRPLRVVMQAFGPYAGRQTLDFRELGDNRFFLIHGPTGSGKTTVLDAMCYALYGQTTGEERSAEQMRSHFADGSVPTEVVLDFSVGDACYRVRRRPQQSRAKLRGTGSRTDAAEATLWRRDAGGSDDDDGTPLATKSREVREHVERIVGFSADQFRQVVMLPQGRFRELLSADSGKREEILQALFGTARYASLEMRLKERKREIGAALSEGRTRRAEALRSVDAEDDERLAQLQRDADAGLLDAGERLGKAERAAAEAQSACEAGRDIRAKLDARETAEREEQAALAACTLVEREAEQAAAALTAELAREPERAEAAALVATLERAARDVAAMEQARGLVAVAEATELGAMTEHRTLEEAASALEARLAEMTAAPTLDHAAGSLATAEAALRSAEEAERFGALLLEASVRTAASVDRQEAASIAASAAEKAWETARRAHDDALAAWRDGHAAVLAQALEAGAPCPVCGATEHPAPAAPATDTPHVDVDASTVTLRAVESTAAAARAELAAARQQSASARDHEDSLRSTLPDGFDAAAAHEAAERARAARAVALADREAAGRAAEETARLEADLAAATDRLRDAEAAVNAARTGLAGVRGRLEAASAAVPEPYRSPDALSSAAAQASLRVTGLSQALESARAVDAQARERLAATREHVRAASRAREAATAAAEHLEPPDIELLTAAAAGAAAERDGVLREVTTWQGRVASLARAAERVADIDAEAGLLGARYSRVAALADAATGDNELRLSFQRYVLGVFLTDVLQAATRRLAIMTRGRYRLHMCAGPRDRRSAAGLDLEVFDEYTGEDRPVSTLSGGEGFLASLALALGLAEVVEAFAGGVHLDTVFVDEGFGTLDEEALDTAIDALMALRGTGRLVGIISHVPELQRAIPARLEVTASPRGSTARFVVP